MEPILSSNPDVSQAGPVKAEGNDLELEGFSKSIDDISQKVEQLEQKLNEVEQFYTNMDSTQPNTSKSSSVVKDKVKEKNNVATEKQQQEASNREEAALRRMQELKRQFATIFRQASFKALQLITQQKWAWPFMHPVDVEGLGLHDYYEVSVYQVIEKPMDFSTIKNKMDGKDGNWYKNVREIYADVRLVFKNAMKYNDERDDVHVMAKSLLEKFEEKWLQLLPKVVEEEERQEEEEAKAQLDMQLTQEAIHANMARDISSDLNEVDMQLEKLREMVVQKCRKMTTEEKKKIGAALTRLSPDDLDKALKIVAENNPSFQATAQEVDLNMDAQVTLEANFNSFEAVVLQVIKQFCSDTVDRK
ncbi:hypothetical protein JRO89_XSUnG0231100 [Xanthoceras sorbifolium]|uniref:Bromo domain-containing protein n=1 Tax=Xanthoceras sorbifolium TaxID=99658 RepID=A0ABQ8GWS7_9ROSI|nr:hypothetical protein JRO89_XSUnG0231100 [Xanthoceras sorbifolium]